jgi:short-subunit dehydrogenase
LNLNSSFTDSIVVITGASLGIGAELARQLAAQGARLALAARNPTQLNAVAAECRSQGARVIAVPTDVTDAAQCEYLIAQAAQEYGRIDMLINNAGVGMWSKFESVQDLTIFDRLMRTNYLGAVYCTHYALPHIIKSRGRIIGVSSLAGKVGVPERSGYSASKFALDGFFQALRAELVDTGVTITVTYPDYVATGGRARNLGPDGKPLANALPYAPGTMTSETCAALILRGAARRPRELHLSLRGAIVEWAKLIAPGLVERITRRSIALGE